MAKPTSRRRGEHAAPVLSTEFDLLSDPDVAGLGRSLATILGGALENPAAVRQALLRYATRLKEMPPVAAPAWLGEIDLYPLRLYHQAYADFVDQLITAAALEHDQQVKARLLTGLLMEAFAPGNFAAG